MKGEGAPFIRACLVVEMEPQESIESTRQLDKALLVVQEYLRELVVQECLRSTRPRGIKRPKYRS